MSLADELLADLEEAGDEDEIGLEGDEGVDQMETIEEVTEETEEDTLNFDRVTCVARLRDSDRFQQILSKIQEKLGEEGDEEAVGPVEADPENKMVVESNNVSAEIDHEINVIHKFVRDKYAKRFPELESLVPMPLEFLATVKELGNEVEKAQNKDFLSNFLLPATVIVVSVTASTTQGQELTSEELAAVNEACDMARDIQEAKMQIFTFVEQRMAFISPNLTAIVGANTSAKLMGVAGGLSQLSKMPACNILVLGAQKRTLGGFSSTAVMPHTGFIFYSPLVQHLPPDLRRKGARLVAAKCALAARIDFVRASPDGEPGRKLREEIDLKLDKWLEPPPPKSTKALPRPLDQASKKRGGRRARKTKERLGMTDMRQKAHRMNFAEIAEDVLQNNIGYHLGQIKSGGSGGKLRGPQVDNKSRARMSKLLQRNIQKQAQTPGGASTVRSKQISGTASSVTFTPIQGLEIVNPQAAESKAAEANAKYFASTAGFLKVQTPLPGGSKDAK